MLRPSTPGAPPGELDLDKVRKFYNSLTQKERAVIEIAFKAWRDGQTLTTSEIIRELKKKGINVNKAGFAAVKVGINRQARKLGLPLPLPPLREGDDKQRRRESKYVLKDEWGRVLEKILTSNIK